MRKAFSFLKKTILHCDDTQNSTVDLYQTEQEAWKGHIHYLCIANIIKFTSHFVPDISV